MTEQAQENHLNQESALIQSPEMLKAIRDLFENWAKHGDFLLDTWNIEESNYSDKYTQGAYMAFFVGFEWGLVA